VFGTHSFPYWARDLREYLVPLMQTFAAPPDRPAKVSFQSIDQTWRQWDWSVSFDRSPAQQFSYLADAGSSGFALRGTGVATVTTPAAYEPGAAATVTMSGLGGVTTTHVVADASGRLHLTVPLDLVPVPGAIGSAAVVGVPDVPPAGSTTTVTIAMS
jgi:hypothetical protein